MLYWNVELYRKLGHMVWSTGSSMKAHAALFPLYPVQLYNTHILTLPCVAFIQRNVAREHRFSKIKHWTKFLATQQKKILISDEFFTKLQSFKLPRYAY